MGSMKIIELTAENVKRLKAVTIRPEGPVQVVAGRNAQGKTSVLDSIWLALGGGAASRDKSNANVVRDGEDTARVKVDLGDLIVTRRWKGDKTSLLVEGADGTEYSRPQEVLDALVGKLSFDPLAFVKEDDRSQVQTLMGLVSLDFDPVALDEERQAIYDKRHLVGQDVARLKGHLGSLTMPDPDLPDAEQPMADALAEYQTAQDEITRHNNTRYGLDMSNSKVTDAVAAVAAAEAALDRAKEGLEFAKADNAKWRDAVDALGQAPDLGPIKARLAELEAVNADVRAAREYRQTRDQLDRVEVTWNTYSNEIADLDKIKADGLAAATFPIEGLCFGDDGVIYNGVPFRQASSAEQLRVSIAMAMAMNPDLRVIRITDGSLLDDANMAMIEGMATHHDFQVWIERVGDADDGVPSVVIEDGKVL